MNPLAIMWLWRLGGALLLMGTLTASYYGWRSHQRGIGAAPYIAAIAVQKKEATAKLAAETDRVNAVNKQLEFALATQEKTDVSNQQKSDGLALRLRDLAAANNGRLRDPAGCGGGGGGAANQAAANAPDRAADGADAGGLLSGPISELFIRLTKEADTINNAYASCRPDSINIRAQGSGLQPSATPPDQPKDHR